MHAIALALMAAAPAALSQPSDVRALVSRADLHYDAPAPRSEDGMPLGNGRMGSLVWTTPDTLRFQVNRVDIYPISAASTSFFERNSDYCCGAAFADVDLGGDVLAPSHFAQHLAIYDGAMSVRGEGVTARLVAWPERDVIAIELDDQRDTPQPIHVSLRMLRYASQRFGGEFEKYVSEHAVAVRTLNHLAISRLFADDGQIALTQEFREGAHYDASAVVARVVGRNARAQMPNETEARLAIPAARGSFTILLGSAARFDPQADVRADARSAVEAAGTHAYAALAQQTATWWHDFWGRGTLDLHSADGAAETVADGYHYFLYLMSASSRGAFPPKFNGMLWNTRGDIRDWGAQHWYANLSCYYEPLPASGRVELMDPMFDMYQGAFDAYAAAARQEWGSEGIYIPETSFFDGLAPLPDDVAAEMRELYLMRKPWEQRSARFMDYAQARHPHSSRWNWNRAGEWKDGRWVIQERGFGPYGAVSHILGTTAKVPYLFWRRYEFTQDREFLRQRAYPMVKGAAEFYRHFPNLQKGDDGRYHIHHVNSNESVYGARDTDEDLSAMKGIFAAAIRAAEILNVDAPLRAAWRDVLDHLPPLPTSDDPEALKPDGYKGPRIFVRGLRPALMGAGRPDGNSLPMWFFDLVSLESTDATLMETARQTFETYFRNGIGAETNVGVLSKIAQAAALLGRSEAARYLVPNQMKSPRGERESAYNQGRPLMNRLALREGHQALDAQRLGRASEALQLALLQSQPPAPGGDPVLRLLPAWPKEWDASFTLLARGAFVVTAKARGGVVESLALESRAGARCRMHNPWADGPVTLQRSGGKTETLKGALLEFPTSKGERLTLSPTPRG